LWKFFIVRKQPQRGKGDGSSAKLILPLPSGMAYMKWRRGTKYLG
jgi:hypothetical protein